MLTMFSELQKYLDAKDRRQWIILLVMSLGAGLAQSLSLAVFNEAVAAYGRGEATSFRRAWRSSSATGSSTSSAEATCEWWSASAARPCTTT
jgi:hypothetical protein